MKIQTYLKPKTVETLDSLVALRIYRSRSHAIRDAVETTLAQQKRVLNPIQIYQPKPDHAKHETRGSYIKCPNCEKSCSIFKAQSPRLIVIDAINRFYHCYHCGYIWRE